MYLNGNDGEGHIRVLRYLLENGLIRKTKRGKLYDISFKYHSQTYTGKYKGRGFTGEIKLADIVDLETGEFVWGERVERSKRLRSTSRIDP